MEDFFEKIRNELANKIMDSYPNAWGIESKNIVKAFLDSPDLTTLNDLERLEIKKCSINVLGNRNSQDVYDLIVDKDKNFFELVRFNYSQNMSYQFPKCLVPIINFAMERNLPIPILYNGKLKMVYCEDLHVENPFGLNREAELEIGL